MAYGQPRGRAHGKGRSQRAIDEDAKHLKNLERFLPNDLASRVEAFLVDQGADSLKQALGGDPVTIARDLAELVNRDVAEEFSAQVARALRGDAREFLAREKNRDFVGEQAHAARQLLVGQWVNLVWSAHQLQPADRLALREEDAMPDVTGYDAGKQWLDLKKETQDFLRVNLALGPDQIPNIYRAFYENLAVESIARSILLPHDMELAKEGDRLYVRQRAPISS